MIIGYWHRKSQFSVEAEALFGQNQIGATINLFLIDLIDGKITEKEKEQMRNYLLQIIKRSGSGSLITSNGKINKSSEAETKVNPERTE
jgi:ribosomal protein S3AE